MASFLQVLPTLRGAVASSASSSARLVRCARGATPATQSALAWGTCSGLAQMQGRGNFTVTNERLEEFLNAEMQYLAHRELNAVKLEQIVHVTDPAEVAKLVHEEIPPRFAQRMLHIESLAEWEEVPMLKQVHAVFEQSFRELRLADADDLPAFTEVIRKLRKRHKPVTPMISQAIRQMYEEAILGEKALNSWVDAFMGSRISTEMLTSHFMACIEAEESGENPGELTSWWGPMMQAPLAPSGIVDTMCDPAYVCQEVADSVMANFQTSMYPMAKIQIQVKRIPHDTDIEFSYVTKYLYFVVQELLTNAVRAVAENAISAEELEESIIKVVVCADEKNVAIRITDKGGGIPFEHIESVWSYVFSTSDRPPHQSIQSLSDPLNRSITTSSPLAGWGMGLPLSRLYVRYLGGSLELKNMPGIGVDTYLFLNRIDLTDFSQDSALVRLFSDD